jgi:hypothetical protein
VSCGTWLIPYGLWLVTGLFWSVRRFIVGIFLVLIARELAKRAAKIVVPRLASALGVESSDHDAIRANEALRAAEAKKTDSNGLAGEGSSARTDTADTDDTIRGLNQNTGVRVLTYVVNPQTNSCLLH